jgi:ribonucleoside-triphosphate reductase (thioredoxin)
MDLSLQILSEITTHGKYAKYLPALQRRETWSENCDRYENMLINKHPVLADEVRHAMSFVRIRQILPSMRAMQFAGPAIEKNAARIYNCAFLPVDSYHAFSETMFLLLGGTGVGYSVQRQHVAKLPAVQQPSGTRRYIIGDSIEGWADAVKVLMKAYFGINKHRPVFDYSDIREKGTRLVTAGGKAPGPGPLKKCLENVERLLRTIPSGRKLRPVEVHAIECFIANAVLSGGIRRAAMIVLFSKDDREMLTCKSNYTVGKYLVDSKDAFGYELSVTVSDAFGTRHEKLYGVSENDMATLVSTGKLPWYYFQEQFGRANNSVALERESLTEAEFKALWKTVENSKAGEPGFYLTENLDWGTNPCCEIALRPFQFCNLTEVNVSTVSSQADLNRRVEAAAFLGTLQASFTDFHYLRDIWKKTTEEDALIGVGMTGIASGTLTKLNLKEAADIVIRTNQETAALIGIKAAARNTTVKPSGTTSCVVGSSSGIHAWHSEYYIRRMRVKKDEAVYTYLQIYHPHMLVDDFFDPAGTAIIEIPIKAPEGATLRTESALDLLERVKRFNLEWVKAGHVRGANTNNVSATISIKPEEWEAVGNWMWDNRSTYNGLSVLDYDGGSYVQAPFEEITREEYARRAASLNDIDMSLVIEMDDQTNHAQEAACAGGACEV